MGRVVVFVISVGVRVSEGIEFALLGFVSGLAFRTVRSLTWGRQISPGGVVVLGPLPFAIAVVAAVAAGLNRSQLGVCRGGFPTCCVRLTLSGFGGHRVGCSGCCLGCSGRGGGAVGLHQAAACTQLHHAQGQTVKFLSSKNAGVHTDAGVGANVELVGGADCVVEGGSTGAGEGQSTGGGGVDDEHALGGARHVGIIGTSDALSIRCCWSDQQQGCK